MATRRLPVIQEPSGADAEAAARPAWQWVLIGSGLLVTIWTPSVALVLLVAQKISMARPGQPAPGAGLAAGLVAVTFALAAVGAGFLVARFGPRAGLRPAVLAGLVGAAEIWLLASLGDAFGSGLVAGSALLSLSGLAAGFCAIGAWLARRKKSPA